MTLFGMSLILLGATKRSDISARGGAVSPVHGLGTGLGTILANPLRHKVSCYLSAARAGPGVATALPAPKI